MAHPFDEFDETSRFVLDTHIDALTRASYLTGRRTGNYPSLGSLIEQLSSPEKNNGLQVFSSRKAFEKYHAGLASYVIQKGYFSEDGRLLPKGIERGSRMAPPCSVEEYF